MEELVKTRAGTCLHLRSCPHLRGAVDLEPVAEARIDEFEICAWCRKEREGVGRIPCASLEDAMRVFGTHPETMGQIRALLRDLDHDALWLPQSRSYIALGLDGVAQAWVGKTYVQWRDGRFEALPGFQGGAGSPGTAAPIERRGTVCPTCFYEMSLAGVCGTCD